MSVRSSSLLIVTALVLTIAWPTPGFTAETKKDTWSWSKLNPFRRDETPLIRPANTRKIAPNRFKPTRSNKIPGKSPWQAVSSGTKKMVDGTKNLFASGDSKKSDSAREPSPPVLKQRSAEKKASLASWLPWSKTKQR